MVPARTLCRSNAFRGDQVRLVTRYVTVCYCLILGVLLTACASGPRVLLNTRALYPTLEPSSRCRIARMGPNIERGQVVIVTIEGVRTLRRIAGIAGDKIEFHNGTLVLNGKKVENDVIRERTPCLSGLSPRCGCRILEEELGDREYEVQLLRPPHELTDARCMAQQFPGPFSVKKNTVFLLADNRDAAIDSRHIGGFPIKSLEAQVLACSPAR